MTYVAPRSSQTRDAIRAVGVLLFGAVAGFALLVALFKLGIAAGVDILFYRGVVLCLATCAILVAVLALLGRRVQVRLSEAIAAGALSLGLNLAFLVVAPVTVDRSISVFLLAQMAGNDARPYSTRDMEAIFAKVYVEDLAQIQRRMTEQVRSGNLEVVAGGYRITPQGRAFIASAHAIGALFDADPRLLAPPTATTMATPAPTRRP